MKLAILILAALLIGCAPKGDGAAVKREVAVLRDITARADAHVLQAHDILAGAPAQAAKIDKAADDQAVAVEFWKHKYDALYGNWWNKLYRILRWAIIGYVVVGFTAAALSCLTGGGLATIAAQVVKALPLSQLFTVPVNAIASRTQKSKRGK